MSNPLLAKGTPHRHLHIAIADALLAVVAACAWKGLFHVPMQDRIPTWIWPAAALLFAVSAAAAYARHRAQRHR
jgi:hypothetical protein